MSRWFSLLLLATALLGLLGQEAAFARTVPVNRADRVVAAAPMTPECAKMMGLTNLAQHPDQPCQGMTPDCVAKMGCAVSLALVEPFALHTSLHLRAAALVPAPVLPLIGRDIGPEPEPPARLG
jgi:hypothetical protein